MGEGQLIMAKLHYAARLYQIHFTIQLELVGQRKPVSEL